MYHRRYTMSGEPRRARRHPLAPLRLRPWLVGLGAVVGLGAGVAAAVVVPPRYRASATLSLEVEAATAAALPPAVATERLLLRVPGIRDRLEQARLAASVEVSATGADRIQVGCVDGSPARAAEIANRLADVLVAPPKAEAAGLAPVDPAALEARLAAARHAVEQTTAQLTRLREATDEGADAATRAAALQRLRGELAAVTDGLARARGRSEQLRGAQEPEPTPDPELASLRRQLESLRTRYTDQHPDVQAVLRRMRELEGAAARATPDASTPDAGERQRADAEVTRLEARQAALEAEIARALAPVPRAGTAEHDRRLTLLTRERERLQEDYLALVKEQAAQQEALVAARTRPAEVFRLVAPATPPQQPFFPSAPAFAGWGLLAGLLLGVAAAFVAEARDGSVRSAEELERLLGRPLLAAIPLVTSRERREHDRL